MNKVNEQQCDININEQKVRLPFNLKEKEKTANESYGDKYKFAEIAEEFCKAEIVNGTAQDFINFSISFSENDDKITACKILRRGLDFYLNDTNLLACFLNCAIDSGIEEEINNCKKFYEKIRTNPLESYTESVFNSVLKYLMTKKTIDSEFDTIKSEAEKIIKMFDKQYPNSDSSYYAHYEYINEFVHDKKVAIAKLEEAVNNLPSCPRCALKLADLLCDEGQYEKACNAIEKCLHSVQSLPNVNSAYVYYLKGVCKYGIFQNRTSYDNNSIDKERFLFFKKTKKETNEQIVKEIYDSFRIAKNEYFNLRHVYRKEIDKIVHVLENQTKIVYS